MGGLVRVDDDVAWDAFVADSPHGTVFATSAFLRALPASCERWFLTIDGRVAAAAVQCLDGERVLDAPLPSVQYQSPMLAGWAYEKPGHRLVKWELETLEALVVALAERYARFSFALHPALRDVRALQWFNYHAPVEQQIRLVLRYTGVLDIRDATVATVLADARFARRYDAKRAAKAGVTFKVVASFDPLAALLEQTFARQGAAWDEHARSTLEGIAEAAVLGAFGEIGVCRTLDGRIAAAALFAYDDATAYYLAAGSDPADRDAGVGTAIVMAFIERAIARGLAHVDFCGVNSPQRGDFKTSFNALPQPYFLAHWR